MINTFEQNGHDSFINDRAFWPPSTSYIPEKVSDRSYGRKPSVIFIKNSLRHINLYKTFFYKYHVTRD